MKLLNERPAAAWLLIVLSAGTATNVNPALAADVPKTYKASTTLPDWSGWWLPQMLAANAQQLNAENPFDFFAAPPLKPKGLALFERLTKAFLAREDSNRAVKAGPGAYCEPFRFTGAMRPDPEAAVEFLLMPERLTITDETGMFRRVYIDDRKLPIDVDETNTGTSVAHWEGSTLVVETFGLSRHAKFSAARFGGAPLGKGAHSTERIFLKRPDVLQIDSVVVAPEALTEPYKRTLLYQRDAKHVPHEFSYCNEYDREIDPLTGNQRFDLTPPEDLPPPPAK